MRNSIIKGILEREQKIEVASSREYSIEELGLTKLIFDREVLLILYNGMKGRIKNIDLRQEIDVIRNLTEKNKYEELIFPTWTLRAEIEGKIEGDISGIIKPRIITKFDKNRTQYIIPNTLPELFFYVIGKNICIEGKSTYMHEAEGVNFKGLECKVRDVNINYITGSIPDIKFTDTFTDNCLIYNGTRLDQDHNRNIKSKYNLNFLDQKNKK